MIPGSDKRQSASEEPASHRAPRPRVAPRILVVEDNRDTAESLRILLQRWGYEVALAFDGPSGMEAARAYRPNLALLDIELPGMRGYEVAERIRKESELREIILVALTGCGRPEDRHRSEEAGFDHHLTKPLDPATLERLLAALE